MTSQPFHVKRIAIIGAGSSGVAAAKYLLAEKTFDVIDIFEQRPTVGGAWNYTPETVHASPHVPRTSPHVPPEQPLWRNNGSTSELVFVSPIYDQLETNIPHFLMQYCDLSFPKDSQLFPQRQVVTRYLEQYAEDVRHLVRFTTQVVDVRPSRSNGSPPWTIKTRELRSQEEHEGVYDAVIVANGHHNTPFIPDIKGITAWDKRYPGVMTHSKFYRKPDDFRGRTVVVVGYAASGVDISPQIARVCAQPLIISSRRESYLSSGIEYDKDERPEILEFLLEDRAVRFADGSVKKNIDAILFCTGYLYTYPFLESLRPELVLDGTRTQHLFQHIFYIPQPTLAFLALPQKVIPFTVAQSQAAVVARVWSNRLQLPETSEMTRWEQELVEAQGPGKLFHALGFPRDAEYIHDLREWALRAKQPDLGKEPPRWGELEYWTRERFPLIKAAFGARRDERHAIRSMSQLGFDYDEWKREQENAPLGSDGVLNDTAGIDTTTSEPLSTPGTHKPSSVMA